jgi:hypothetical protein
MTPQAEEGGPMAASPGWDDDGIRDLMVAVLQDSVDLLLHSKDLRVLAAELEWLRSNEEDHPFRFRRICAVLDLPPGSVRTIVLRRRTFPRWMLD